MWSLLPMVPRVFRTDVSGLHRLCEAVLRPASTQTTVGQRLDVWCIDCIDLWFGRLVNYIYDCWGAQCCHEVDDFTGISALTIKKNEIRRDNIFSTYLDIGAQEYVYM